ncbi:FMN-dependent NADH-azoreductase [Granulicella sp. 5B5]|uniref:FMN-dependent NADH-azoreductase n=1 Tax=Granulicella sp. 5B5 TaxID=1617967 RepID=UPI0015F47E46|nr:NAD(P)H-dependent oxidoreductase [Granulicella sp. 5B5]QMV18715.1 FMN-dependent NADH-azoreductase [Granulicella sp. 5B5]
MSTLLHLDSSPTGDHSVSRALTAEFVKHWQAANPGSTVITRDLTTTPLAPVDGQWIGAAYTPADSRTAEQKAALALSDTLTGELFAADEFVFGIPMYNFGVPGAFKLWIDQIARVGVTFAYVDGKPQGLLNGKKAHFFIATGGDYSAASPFAAYNFVEPYLRATFGFLGVVDTTFQSAYGAAALNYGADRAEFLAPQLKAIHAAFANA